MTAQPAARPSQLALSIFWFAWELHWAALLGATLQAEIARFEPPTFYGRASALIGGLGALLAIFVQYGAGRISDLRRMRMPFIIVGTLLDVGALYSFALAPSFGAAVVAVAAINIALNIAGGPYQALIPDRVAKAAQGRASAVMGFMRLAGTAVGLLLAKLLVYQPGPSVTSTMFTDGLLRLVTVIAAILLVALAVTVFGVREQPGDVAPPAPLFEAWPSRASFVWLVISRTLVSCGLYLILPFLGFYLEFALHVQQYKATSLDLLMLMVVCSLVGTVPAGMLGDRYSKKSIIYIALALVGAGALLLAGLKSLGPMTPIAIFIGIGWGAYYSVDWALACNLLPPGRAGALMALWNIGSTAPQVAAPLVGGLLIDHLGAVTGDLGSGYRAVFVLLTACVAGGAGALVFVREIREGPAQRRP